MKKLQRLLLKIQKKFLESKTTYYKTPIGIAEIVGNENGIQSISVLDESSVSLEKTKDIPVCLKDCVIQLEEYF